MQGKETTEELDQYDTLLRSMEEGLLVSINNEAQSELPTGELRVEHSSDDRTEVRLKRGFEDWMKVHRDARGDLVLSDVTEDGLSYEADVITIEIIGLDGTDDSRTDGDAE